MEVSIVHQMEFETILKTTDTFGYAIFIHSFIVFIVTEQNFKCKNKGKVHIYIQHHNAAYGPLCGTVITDTASVQPRPQPKPSVMDCSHTATHSSLTFNGLHLCNSLKYMDYYSFAYSFAVSAYFHLLISGHCCHLLIASITNFIAVLADRL